jgi:multidrug efflux pump subunit AcrB
MLESFFNRITKSAIRFKWVTIALALIFSIAGVVAFTQLKRELIPSIEFPQTVVLAFYNGAESQTILDEVTIPLEDAISQVDGVVNIESTTSNGVAYLIARNEFGLDQDTLRADIQAALDNVDYPEGMETPELLTFSFADLPIASVSVSAEGRSLAELKTLVESEINPQLEAIDGVGGVEVGGGQELPTEPPPTPIPSPTPTLAPTSTPTEEPSPTPEPTEVMAEAPGEGPIALPDTWVQAAAAGGVTLETTADLSPEVVSGIVSFAPQLLADLTPEMLLAMPVDALTALPADYLAGLDPDLQAQIAARMAAGEAPPEEEADPRELPQAWKAAGASQNLTLVYPEDITPEILRGVAEFAPQLLDMLTPVHLRGLSPEVLGWLPAAFVESLDPALKAELDDLAAEVGGVGALAAAAEAESDALSEGAPELSGVWLEPPDAAAAAGPLPSFETAADLINNGFTDSAAALLNLLVENAGELGPDLIGDLSPKVIAWLVDNEENFLKNLSPAVLRLLSPEVLSNLPEEFLASLDESLRQELEGIAAGTVEVFIPTSTINRVNGNPSLGLSVFQDQEANTVSVSHEVFDKLDELEAANPGLQFFLVFEQASFIEESINGVTREGALGALFAIVVILIFLSGRVNGRYNLSWRSTLVIAVSIPLSILMAFTLLQWLPPLVSPLFDALASATSGIPIVGALTAALKNLFPVGITLNIMTLSGMTVAVGRVVDDSIVVLENTYRHIQRGEEQLPSVLIGARDVSIAIFASTVTTVIVFLPIGLLGGLIGGFFLPFGIAVTYALASSFLVAITVIPLLAFLFIRKEHLPAEHETGLQRRYTPILEWALGHRGATLAIAGVLFIGSLFLMSTLPRAFLPDFGEVQITATVDLPGDVQMAETDAQVMDFETSLAGIEGVGVVQSEVGSTGGLQARFLGGGIDQSQAGIQIGVDNIDDVDALTREIRAQAEKAFGQENVTVSSGSLSSGAFGAFALVASGAPEQLAAFNQDAIDALNDVDGLANVSSNLTDLDTILRVDSEPAVRFTGELETEDTLGVTAAAKTALQDLAPAGVTISEGFETQQQTEGFSQAVRALGISIIAVYFVMVITFRSFVHPFTILFSLPMAVIGAALALWLTGSIVGLSSLVGMMMLVGIVVTNAIVLLDRVQANRAKRDMDSHGALVEAGRTRLRPILMTATAAILALVPLAIGLSQGAIVASELAIVVIGGLTTSTLLTLLIVPVMYSLLDRLTRNRKKTSNP